LAPSGNGLVFLAILVDRLQMSMRVDALTAAVLALRARVDGADPATRSGDR
jgi:hypothetical protein